MAGRKRKHPKLHLVAGTRPNYDGSGMPAAPAESPRAPDWLSKRACELFGALTARLEAMGIASSADTELLSILALRLEEIELRDADVRAAGATYVKHELIEVNGETRVQEILKANPAVAQKSEAMRHAQGLLAEFGLTPAARSKVSAGGRGADPQESAWERLSRGMR